MNSLLRTITAIGGIVILLVYLLLFWGTSTLGIITPVTVDNEQQVLNSKGIVVIDFYADWCQPCKKFSPMFEQMAKQTPDCIFAKVDCTSSSDIAAKYGVKSLPTVLILKDGKESARHVGLLPSIKNFQALINEGINGTDLSKLSKDELRSRFLQTVMTGSTENIERLIRAGFDLNLTPDDSAIIHSICTRQGIDLFKKLVLLGVKFSFNHPVKQEPCTLDEYLGAMNSSYQQVPERIAFLKSYTPVHKQTKPAQPDAKAEELLAVLFNQEHITDTQKCLAALQALIENGADINAKPHGLPLLVFVIMKGYPKEVIRFLADRCDDVKATCDMLDQIAKSCEPIVRFNNEAIAFMKQRKQVQSKL